MEVATQEIWDRYFHRLVTLSRGRLQRLPGGANSDEDVALSAFETLFRGLANGRFPDLSDRDSLLRLLVKIAMNKAANLVRDKSRLCRGDGRVVNEAVITQGEGGRDGLAAFPSKEPGPEFSAMVQDEFRRLLAVLPNEEHRTIARLKLDGQSDREIADLLRKGLRTVERKVAVIRAALTYEEAT